MRGCRLLPEGICQKCGKAIPPRPAAHYRNKPPMFCSRHCAGRSVNPDTQKQSLRRTEELAKRSCVVCGNTGWAKPGRHSKRVTCSDVCLKKHDDEAWRKSYVRLRRVDPGTRTCAHCGAAFRPAFGDKRRRWCSLACHRQLRINLIKIARQRGECIKKLEVFIRDGWRCQLCGVRTSQHLMGTRHERAPELDHIVPLARGGEHSYDNVQLACHSCNMKKSARVWGQLRLRLVG